MLTSPYRGIHPFRYVDQAHFFGREGTVAELLARVLVSRMVLLFGESGTGKSSLINAGLIPALEKEGLNPERLRVRPIPEEPILIERIPARDADDNPFLPSILDEKRVDIDADLTVPCSLERFLKTIHEAEAYPVLIFDQFEELFTLFAQDRDKAVADLLDAIFEIVSNENLRVKVVIVIREDFLGKLEILAKNYPQVFDHRVRLGHLDQNSARKAILGPFENTNPFPSRLTPELAERIIQDLSNSQPNVQIQPTQLQIICSRLWEEYAPKRSEITVEEFAELGKVKGIIERFFESELAGVEPALRSQTVEILGHLITESGTRDVVSQDRLNRLITVEEDRGRQEPSLTQIVLEDLEERRVIYKTAQRGTYYYELANEYLVKPIQQLAREQERAKVERQARAKVMARATWIVIASLIVALLAVGWAAFEAFRQRNVAVEQGNARATAQVQAEAEADARATAQVQAEAEADARAMAQAQAEAEAAARATAEAKAIIERDAARQAKATAVAAEAEAVAQRDTATSRQLAAQALTGLDGQLDLALLLGLEAYWIDNTLEARSSLLIALEHNPHLATFLHGHTDWVRSVAFSPDGQMLASGSADGTIVLWDVMARQPLGQPLVGHMAEVWSVAFSPDGQTLASGGADGTIVLWNDVATGQPTGRPLTGHDFDVFSVAFSPDSQTLASGSRDLTIMLWNVETGQPIGHPLTGHAATVRSLAFSPDGQTLASGDTDGAIILWNNVATGQPISRRLTGHDLDVFGVAFSPDSQTLASGSRDLTIMLWDVPTGEPIGHPLTGHSDSVFSVAFSPDGQTLASGSRDLTIMLWDVATGQSIGQPLTGHSNWVNSVAFSPDGQTLASGSTDNAIILWDVAGRQSLGQALTGHTNWVRSVAFSPDGQTLASGSEDNTIILWDIAAHQPLSQTLTGHSDWVNSVAFSPDSQTLASGSADNTIILWDVSAHQTLSQTLTSHTANVRSVAFSPDGQTLASGSCGQYDTNRHECNQGEVRLWEASSGQPIGQVLTGHTNWVRSVAFSPDSRMLASGSEDNTITLWDVVTGQPIGQPLNGHTNAVLSVAFSPDGRTLASGSYRTIILWDLTAHQPLGQPLTGYSDWVRSVAFSPDGQTLASGSADGAIILWDVANGQPIGQPVIGHTDAVLSVAFSPDNQKLASGSADNTIILWDASFELWQARACRIANRNLTQTEWNQFIGPDIPYERTCPDLLPGEGAPRDAPAATY
jgi:WD40 repeat protein